MFLNLSCAEAGMSNNNKKTAIAYAGIISVVFIWAVIPLVKKALIGGSFSASIFSAVTALSSALVLLVINRKKLKELNAAYFRAAVPTGVCLGGAALAQALAYNFDASPTNQAFLENLSCIIVPVMLFVAVKKKPTALTITASVVCLASSVVLSGALEMGMKFHTADILNAVAGVLYGVNIAVTGIYAGRVVPSLYVMIQLFVQSVLSFAMAVAFNFICIGERPIDPFAFSFDPWLILALVGVGVISNALCWTIRTSAMRYVSANVVAVIMPFSAVVTGIIAVAIGSDSLSISLVVGAILGLAASLLSATNDVLETKKHERGGSNQA